MICSKNFYDKTIRFDKKNNYEFEFQFVRELHLQEGLARTLTNKSSRKPCKTLLNAFLT